ncbi:hypothetical protein G9A89_017284 [Geosiphon pyriformis]|nr:hypothetical protein G9A89_017284 [Geosiphon pyriformis]
MDSINQKIRKGDWAHASKDLTLADRSTQKGCRIFRSHNVIPPFELSDIVRTITRKTYRKMLCWAHYRFLQRPIVKAEELEVRVIIQNEVYTSKTCGCCGNIQRIGASEVYSWRCCKLVMDRDENGAQGVSLQALLGRTVTMLSIAYY